MLKVYLDDVRFQPKGWILARTVKETIDLLKSGDVVELSLDHDLGDDVSNGYDVVLWIEENVVMNNFNPPVIHVHSANVSARKKMELGIKNIEILKLKNKFINTEE